MTRFVAILALATLAACGGHRPEAASGTSGATTSSAGAATGQSAAGGIWHRCMVQGEMPACQEIWKGL